MTRMNDKDIFETEVKMINWELPNVDTSLIESQKDISAFVITTLSLMEKSLYSTDTDEKIIMNLKSLIPRLTKAKGLMEGWCTAEKQ